VISINSFAFTCHSSISPILKENKNPGNNKKAIFLGFFIMAIMYMLVGIGGALAIYGKNSDKKRLNVLNYF
jgi:amino acid permease